MTNVPVGETQRKDAQGEGGEGRVKMDAGIGVMQPQAKEYLEPQKLGEPGKILPWSFWSFWKEPDPADTLISDFWPP